MTLNLILLTMMAIAYVITLVSFTYKVAFKDDFLNTRESKQEALCLLIASFIMLSSFIFF